MELGINIDFFAKSMGMEKAAEMVSKAGFRYLDYTPPLKEDNWEAVAKENIKIFNESGLKVHQTHAPFNRYGHYGDGFKLFLDRCMEATSLLGAEYVAVHGDEFDFENMKFSEDAAFCYNHELFAPYVSCAEKNGFKMAFETVFEDGHGNGTKRRYTSDAEELMKLILSFKSESAVCCWDFGHANVSFGKSAPEQIEKFGALIQCTHLHDNAGNDSHQMPMTGDINWSNTMKALNKAGYSGVLSVEYAHGKLPPELTQEYLNLTYKTAKYLSEIR